MEPAFHRRRLAKSKAILTWRRLSFMAAGAVLLPSRYAMPWRGSRMAAFSGLLVRALFDGGGWLLASTSLEPSLSLGPGPPSSAKPSRSSAGFACVERSL